jgi:undecaprenyl phosphate N,N'-diacetylbacillosamine 1-phosphate transferase
MTITDERDEYGKLLPNYKHITQTRKFVRSTSLDEWPQLIKMLKGGHEFIRY